MYIGIDIGGTHIRVATGRDGEVHKKLDFATREFHASIQEIKEAVGKLTQEQRITRVGIGVPGPFNTRKVKTIRPPNLIGWDNIEIGDVFTKLLKFPVVVANDASAAALGEATYGAGKSKNPVLYYTVSTGVGTGLVVDGRIFHGIINPEAGHQIIDKSGPRHKGAPAGDLESLSSGSAVKRLYGETPAEAEGEPEWIEAIDWLAIGLTNSILHFSPEIVVIGGGMTKHKHAFFPPLNKTIKKYLKEVPPVPIVPSGLGQDSGIIGALALAQRG
ncbi:MAG: ROK family protein [Candidatus Woykebacteria bacterium]